MSIADRITSMTQHTKEAYDKIESLGADLTGVNKNLDNIADVLDDVYAGYPKVTGSGTELSLSNCKKAGMEIEYKGTDTTQDITTGKNKIKISGNTETINGITFTQNDDGSISAKGTATEDTQYVSTTLQELQPSATYRMSGCPSGGSTSTYRLVARIRVNATTNVRTVSDTGYGLTFTNTDNGYYILGELWVYSGQTVDLTFYPQVELGSTTTTFEKYTGGIPAPNPSYPQDIHTVTGNNTIKVSGKNLFNVDSFNKEDKTYISGGITSIISNGKISCNGTATSTSFGIGSSDYTFSLKLKSNTNYVFSRTNAISERLYIRLYNADKSQYQDVQIVANSTSTSFTTNFEVSSCYLFMAGHSNGDNISINSFGVMIEQGSTATAYEAYQAPGSYPVNLKSKNLFDYDTIISKMITNSDFPSNYSYNASTYTLTMTNQNSDMYLPKIYNQAPFITGVNVTVKPNTNYTFSYEADQPVSTLKSCVMGLNNSNKYSYITGLGEYKTISFNSGEYTQITFRIGSKAAAGTVTHFSNFMLEEGSIKTDFEPYYNYELCKIGTAEDYIRKSTGKNLFDKSTSITEGQTYTNTGETTRLDNSFIQESYISVLSSTAYTMSTTNNYSSTTDYRLVICEYDANKNFIQRNLYASSNKFTLTTTANTKYVRLCASTVTINELQLELGSTATEYEPYGKVWYKKNSIGKVVLNGVSKAFTDRYTTNTANKYRFKTEVSDIKNQPSGEIANVFCNIFVAKTIGNTYSCIQGISVNDVNHRIIIYADVLATMTLEQANNWLKTNNVTIYYILETPTNTIITEQALITQLEAIKYSTEGTTIITQTNEDKPFIISASALLKQS